MYQPALRPDQIRALYLLKTRVQRPMTALVREAVDEYQKEGAHKDHALARTRASCLSVGCPPDSPRHGPRG